MSAVSTNIVDISENELLESHEEVFKKLLLDHTTQKNIFWATDSYASLGEGYGFHDEITIPKITGIHGNVIRPRSIKSREEQSQRAKDMAEVFTPSWVCNAQNNLIDESWFGRKDVFNHEETLPDGTHSWTVTEGKIEFPEGHTWQEYICRNELEITCGEAPYLVSRYDSVSGKAIQIERRIGLIDRKMRIVNENAVTDDEWKEMSLLAFKSSYGYEWQGDSLFIARENVFQSYVDYYRLRFRHDPNERELSYAAEVVSWNLWQMDGLKFVLPKSCHDTRVPVQQKLFASSDSPKFDTVPCPGCKRNDRFRHNGIYAKIMNWANEEPLRFVDLLKKKR